MWREVLHLPVQDLLGHEHHLGVGTAALHGEGYRLAVHPRLHRNQHAYRLGSSGVGNRYGRKPPRVRSTTDRLGVVYARYPRSAAEATVSGRKCTKRCKPPAVDPCELLRTPCRRSSQKIYSTQSSE